jgi:hypothetical protein
VKVIMHGVGVTVIVAPGTVGVFVGVLLAGTGVLVFVLVAGIGVLVFVLVGGTGVLVMVGVLVQLPQGVKVGVGEPAGGSTSRNAAEIVPQLW